MVKKSRRGVSGGFAVEVGYSYYFKRDIFLVAT